MSQSSRSGRMIGYARVSTDGQNLDLQHKALKDAGCSLVFSDTVSGATFDRKGLARALRRCRAGDTLVVWKLDRLGRSLIDLIGLVERLRARGIGFRVLTGQGATIDTTRPEGRMIFAVFASLAEFERELIRERTKAGIAAAQRRGVHCGRPPKLTPDKLALARKSVASGKSIGEVAHDIGVHYSTLRRALKVKSMDAKA